jgi:predicted glycosyltransferase
MNLRSNATRLTLVTRDLANHWQETKAYWRDAKSREFEKKYLEELLAAVDRTVNVIEQLDKVVVKIRSDCE